MENILFVKNGEEWNYKNFISDNIIINESSDSYQEDVDEITIYGMYGEQEGFMIRK